MDLAAIEREYADLIERHMIVTLVRVADELSAALLIPDIATDVLAALQPSIPSYAKALAASVAAGETAEQLEERLAALKIKES